MTAATALEGIRRRRYDGSDGTAAIAAAVVPAGAVGGHVGAGGAARGEPAAAPAATTASTATAAMEAATIRLEVRKYNSIYDSWFTKFGSALKLPQSFNFQIVRGGPRHLRRPL